MAEQTLLAPGIHHFSLELEGEDTGLFRGHWPLPRGLLTQTYGIKGTKTALVDWNPLVPEAEEVLRDLLGEADFNWGTVDYFFFPGEIPGSIAHLARENPQAKFLLPKNTVDQTRITGLPADRITWVSDGDHLDLGSGRVLRFIAPEAPSQPTSLLAWEESSGCLFTGDIFSSFGVVEDKYFWDQMNPQEGDFLEEESFRAYACLWPQRAAVLQSCLEHIRTAAWPIGFLAPSFGPLYRGDISQAVDLWNHWRGYQTGETEKEVSLVVLSGCPKDLEEELLSGVLSEAADLEILRLPEDGPDLLKASLLRSRGIILAGGTDSPPASNWLKELDMGSWGPRWVLTTQDPTALRELTPAWTWEALEGRSPREAAQNLARKVKRGE